MSLTYINNHVQDARDKMLQQYKEAASQVGLIDAFVGFPTQDQEDLFWSIIEDRRVLFAVGAQLDAIGEIVQEPRNGNLDNAYRVLIFAKIGQNVSKSDPEQIITVAKLLVGANLAFFQEYWPAGYGVSMSEDIASQDLVNKAYERLDKVDAGGVRLEAIGCFDETEAFAFAGGGGIALGFGDSGVPTTGGMFGKLHVPSLPAFSFAAASADVDNDLGFGTLLDGLFGGIFQ